MKIDPENIPPLAHLSGEELYETVHEGLGDLIDHCRKDLDMGPEQTQLVAAHFIKTRLAHISEDEARGTLAMNIAYRIIMGMIEESAKRRGSELQKILQEAASKLGGKVEVIHLGAVQEDDDE